MKPNASKAKGISRWKDSLKNKYTGHFPYKNLTLGSRAGREKMWFSLMSHVSKSGRWPGRAERRWVWRSITRNHILVQALPLPAVWSWMCHFMTQNRDNNTYSPMRQSCCKDSVRTCTQHSAQNIAVGARNGFCIWTESARCTVSTHPSPFPLSPP